MIGLRGFGAFTLPSPPVWIDPGIPPNPDIVAANTAASNAYQLAVAQAQVSNNDSQCVANANQNPEPFRTQLLAACGSSYSAGGAGYDAALSLPYTGPSGAVASAPLSGGHVTFSTSRGSNAAQVGDSWQVAITGATPNTPVTVSGQMPGGAFSGTPMGSTDGSGNFSKTGTFSSSDVGSWSEGWAVGGLQSGGFNFSVAPAVVSTSGVVSPAVLPPIGGPVLVAPPSSTVTPGGFSFSSIPWWGWAAGAGVALLAFGGGSRGR